MLIGGIVETELAATTGRIAQDSLIEWSESHMIDVVVLSTSGLAERADDGGTTSYVVTCDWQAEADIQSEMFRRGLTAGTRLVLLVGQQKLGKQDMFEFGCLDSLAKTNQGSRRTKVSILTTKIGADKERARWLNEFKSKIEAELRCVEMVFVPERPPRD